MKHPIQWMAFSIIALFVFSCESEDPEVFHLPKQVIRYEHGSPSDTLRYTYSGNRMVKIDRGYIYKYHYHPSGQLESCTWQRPGESEKILMRYAYLDNRLSRTTLFSSNPEDANESEVLHIEYSYPSEDIIQRIYVDITDPGTDLEEWYFNDGGNIHMKRHYYPDKETGEWVHTSTSLYQFDLSYIPFEQLHEREAFEDLNNNNIILEEVQDRDGNVINSREYSYIYDSKDFPVYRLGGKDTLERYIY